MNAAWLVARKELARYFTTPVGYIVYSAGLFLHGMVFLVTISGVGPDSNVDAGDTLQRFLIWTSIWMGGQTLMIAVPLFTDEWQLGSIRLLYSSPLTEAHIVFGKILASSLFILAVLVISLYLPLTFFAETNFSRPQLFAGYLGLFFFLSALMAITGFFSVLMREALSAFIVSSAVVLALIMTWMIAGQLPDSMVALKKILLHIGIWSHFYEGFTTGQITLSGLIFYTSVIIFFGTLTAKVLESRRWK